jgi:pimeloyl-ACP methyl ester carboxylesterase
VEHRASSPIRTGGALLTLLLVLAMFAVAPAAADAAPAGTSDTTAVPVVFVHGNSGSASQFETHAMRFTSNGYPQGSLFAFEYDTSQPHGVVEQLVNDQLDTFLDDVAAQTGHEQVHVAAHSRGTTVMHSYLSSPDRAERVARYVNLDGRQSASPPGGVPTLAVWGEWNPTSAIGGAANAHFPDKGHTEVATAAETFALMYEHFTGSPPATTDVVPEPPGRVTLAGRATIFPENVGVGDATVEMWEVDPDTGERIGNRPRATTPLDDDGAFGPFRAHGAKYYEFAIVRSGQSVHHFYVLPQPRSNHFLRLQTSHPGEGIAQFIETGDVHSALTISRNREWWGDQGDGSDVLRIDGVDVVNPASSPRRAVNIGVFVFDRFSDGQSDPAAATWFPFSVLPFLTAVDLYLPASSPPDDPITVEIGARGSGTTEVINVPNWPSSEHRVSILVPDHVQDTTAFTAYPRGAGGAGRG